MADVSIRPASQLLEDMTHPETRETNSGLRAYLEKGGSIFSLVEKGHEQVARDFGVNPQDAKQLLRGLNSMVIHVRRQFIEHSLTGGEKAVARPSSGLLSFVTGPNYEQLFGTPFDTLCPPDALESIASPVAYLIELLRWIRDRIEAYGVAEEKFPLHDRRTDLKKLSVDFNAVHKSVSAVDIIVSVLEDFITSHEPDAKLEEALIEARYPNGLPYYQHWVTMDAIALDLGLSVGNFAHVIDFHFPYFLLPGAWGADAGRAMAHASRMGPYQRKLLTEPPAVFDGREAFFARNFGTDDLYKYQNLDQVNFFGERSKLDTRGIETLLSVGNFEPVRSANVTYEPVTPAGPESELFGSTYVNARTAPPIKITSGGEGPSFLHRLSAKPDIAEDFARFDRLNRKVRLDILLDMPSNEVDALLAAAIRADVRGGATAGKWWITDNVVHALGLFQLFRERYGCTAQDFAVFIDALSIYGRGDALSQFDQVFNSQGNYRQPLKLDNLEFATLPAEGATDLTVNQLCSGLDIDLQTYAYLALVIAQAHNLTDKTKLKRSAAIISSFYRLVTLARMLDITPVEGVLMLTLLGGESWVKGLAGLPQINNGSESAPDVLNLIYAMHSCVGWCKDRDIPVLWMLQQVSEPRPSASSELELQLFTQVGNLLPAALLTNAGLLMAGVPALPAADWLDLLRGVADADGLVLAPRTIESAYPAYARAEIEKAVKDGLGDIEATLRAAIVEQMFGVLVQARDAQASVVKECLAVYAGVDAEQAIQVLDWANATIYQLLRLVVERIGTGSEEPVRVRNEQPDPLLTLLADVRRRSAVVTRLNLSAVLLREYLDYGYRSWIGQDDKHAFSVGTLYYLTALTRAFELSEQPAQKLFDYLRQVNELPNINGDALALAQQASSIILAEFFGWSVQEVRECVARIDPALKVLKNLKQLDMLMRILVLSKHSGMKALTIFQIGKLPETVDTPAAKQEYATAAENALLSLSESPEPSVQTASDLKQLVDLQCTVVGGNSVVANKPGEKISFKVTLKDAAGAPLKGVNVYWHATLGNIGTLATGTDGTLVAVFIPGSMMGTETPLFWLDLFDAQPAPVIEVIADPLSLQFPRPLMSPIPLGPVAVGDEVELYAKLMDRYGNLGESQLVQWFSETEGKEDISVIIRPRQGFTDKNGLTRVFVSCSGGTVNFSVRAESNVEAVYGPITFEGDRSPG